MRSGIGDGAELQEHGIDVVHHAPQVGRNLQDHISSPVQYSTPTTIPYGISWRTLPWLAWTIMNYALFRRGLLANTGLQAGGFVRSRPGLDRPDIQFILMPAERTPDGRMGIGHGYGLITILLRPKSSGTVKLAGPRSRPCAGHRSGLLQRAGRSRRHGARLAAGSPYSGSAGLERAVRGAKSARARRCKAMTR